MLFRGEYDCTKDEKGRIKMPAALRKLFPAEDQNRFMIAKDIEDCLVIYPLKTWEKTEQMLAGLSSFNTNHRKFYNAITVGLSEVEMDSADRFLISKSLLKYLGNGKEIILKGNADRIQVWEAGKYEQFTQINISNIQQLADEASNYLDGRNDKKELQ
jgi:MraZ protein